MGEMEDVLEVCLHLNTQGKKADELRCDREGEGEDDGDHGV